MCVLVWSAFAHGDGGMCLSVSASLSQNQAGGSIAIVGKEGPPYTLAQGPVLHCDN